MREESTAAAGRGNEYTILVQPRGGQHTDARPADNPPTRCTEIHLGLVPPH